MVRRVLALLCLAVLPATAATPKTYTEHHRESFTVNQQWKVNLHNEVGDVSVIGWDEPRVQIDWNILAYSKPALDVAWVEINTDAQMVDIRTAYPVMKTNAEKTRIKAAGPDSINYIVHVPRNLRSIELSTRDGNVDVSGIQSELRLSSLTGTVAIEGVSGNVDVSTVHARQTLKLASVSGNRSIHLESVDGSVRVFLSRESDVKVVAASASGAVDNEFGWARENRPYDSSSNVRGSLGYGTANLSINEVYGSITLSAEPENISHR